MTLTIYISNNLFAAEIMSGQNLIFREICEKERFITLMEELELPDTYTIKSSVVGLSEYMKIGKLKNMIPVNVEQLDNLDLRTHFGKGGSNKPRVNPWLISLIFFFLGVLIMIPFMNYYVVQDMLRTREERISGAQHKIQDTSVFEEPPSGAMNLKDISNNNGVKAISHRNRKDAPEDVTMRPAKVEKYTTSQGIEKTRFVKENFLKYLENPSTSKFDKAYTDDIKKHSPLLQEAQKRRAKTSQSSMVELKNNMLATNDLLKGNLPQLGKKTKKA